MASEIEIETEMSQKTQEKDTGSNHVVPVMLTFYDTDRKILKERSSSRVCINSKENENIVSFYRHIITFLAIKEQAHSLGVQGFLLKIFRLQINNGKGEKLYDTNTGSVGLGKSFIDRILWRIKL